MDDSTMLMQRRARGPCTLPLEALLMDHGNADRGSRRNLELRVLFASSKGRLLHDSSPSNGIASPESVG